MNHEIRSLLNKKHIKKITIKNKVKIIEDNEKIYVIKRKEKDLKEVFQYLKSRSFHFFPEIIDETENYYIYQYINSVDIPTEEKANDMIKLLSILHSKTTFYKEIDDNTYKELYENITNEIDYLYHYYNDIIDIFEKEEFMSPSAYFFIRNSSKILNSLQFAKENIEKWYTIIEKKKRIRIATIHNNLKLDHYLLEDKPYFISWELSKKDLPIYDMIKLYKTYYKELDFCTLLRTYENNFPMLKEEKILFFVLISIPQKLDFNEKEYQLCKKIKKFYDNIYTTEKLIIDYFPKEEQKTK